MAATSNVWICTIGNCHLPKLCYSHGLWWNKLFLDHAIRSGCEICPKYFLLAYQTINYNKCSFRVFSFSVARAKGYKRVRKGPMLLFFWLFLPSAAALCLLSNCCFFCQISPLLSSPLFCWWWNCPNPYIIWNMSWWSRTCEELGIISSRPYITFSSLLCYDALMLQVYDQMMIDMFLRPLLLLLLIFLYIIVL